MATASEYTAHQIALAFVDDHKEAIATIIGCPKTSTNHDFDRNAAAQLATTLQVSGHAIAATKLVADMLPRTQYFTLLPDFIMQRFGMQANSFYAADEMAARELQRFWMSQGIPSRNNFPQLQVRSLQVAVMESITSIMQMVLLHWKHRFFLDRSFARLALFEVIEHLNGQKPPIVRQVDYFKMARTLYLRDYPDQEEYMRASGWFAKFDTPALATYYIERFYQYTAAFHWAYGEMRRLADLSWPPAEEAAA